MAAAARENTATAARRTRQECASEHSPFDMLEGRVGCIDARGVSRCRARGALPEAVFRGEIFGAAHAALFSDRPRRGGPQGPSDNARMPDATDPDAIDKRLTDLEVKASFSEDLLDHLNALVTRQQEQIALLIREVGKLKDRAPDVGGGATSDLLEDRPPHY
jgi:SlyX protein